MFTLKLSSNGLNSVTYLFNYFSTAAVQGKAWPFAKKEEMFQTHIPFEK
jgi:hypothetical protein